MRRAAKTDDNHAAIKESFTSHGCKVFDISHVGGGWPDLVVARFGRTAFVEVKGAKGKLTPAQVVFLARAGNQLPIYFAQTDQDVETIVQHLKGVS